MASLNPVNLTSVLEDLDMVIQSTMMLGGRVIDFSDPLGSVPGSETLGLAGDEFLRIQLDAAWENIQVSLRRLKVSLQDGDVELLDCPAMMVQQLKMVWTLLGDFYGADKPEFIPGRPAPRWSFSARRGGGKLLKDTVWIVRQLMPDGPTVPTNGAADNPNSKTNTGKKSPPRLPESPDVRDLCKDLQDKLSDECSQIDIAREFTEEREGDDKKAQSLLRQARRFKHLWKPADK